MKKYFIAVAVLALTPSIAFASWWNPISWNWSAFFNGTVGGTQVQTPIVSAPSQNTSATNTVSVTPPSTPTPVIPKPAPKIIQKVPQPTTKPPVISTPVVPITSVVSVPTASPVTPTPLPNMYQTPTISSINEGTISGQNFTGVNSVYVTAVNSGSANYPIQLPFSLVNDGSIAVNATLPVGNYYLYVANRAGETSAPFQTAVYASQTTQEQSTAITPTVSATCQQAEQNLETLQQTQANIANMPMDAEVAAGRAAKMNGQIQTAATAAQIACQ